MIDFEGDKEYHAIRGVLISEFCTLELAMELFIIQHFKLDESKGSDLKTFLLTRMTFESKRQVVAKLLELKSIENGFIKTKKNKFPHADFWNELVILNEIRNQFAHFALFRSPADSQHIIGLLNFRDSVKAIEYTESSINEFLKRIKEATNRFIDLYKEYK